MSKIFDYKCIFLDNLEISTDEINKNNIKFPDVHINKNEIVRYAKLRKEVSKAHFVEVPFCHTVEAESMGAIINYGDNITGPRVREFAYKTLSEILSLPKIDFTKGRINEVINAIKILNDENADIVLEATGPITILNNLVDSGELFKTIRKDRELIKNIYNKLSDDLYNYIKISIDNGAKYISFADSAAAVGIIGPKITREYVEDFLYEFVKKLYDLAKKENAIILLCPRLTFALYGMDLIKFNNVVLSSEMSYFDALKEVIGKIYLTGQMCIKNVDYKLKPAYIKELVLLK